MTSSLGCFLFESSFKFSFPAFVFVPNSEHMTRLITLVMGMMVLAFTAFATPNPVTAPTKKFANNGKTLSNGVAVSNSSKIDVSSENGMLTQANLITSLHKIIISPI